MNHSSWCGGLLTAAILAMSGIVVPAKTATHTRNAFESAYYYLALQLGTPELCDKISLEAVEQGPVFSGSGRQIHYVQSKCFYDLAVQLEDVSLCARVRTISTFLRKGSGLSEAKCRERVAKGRTYTGGNFGTGLLLGVMGYPDDEIRKQRVSGRNKLTDELKTRFDRLPDFSRGDAAAIRQLDAAMPQCADRNATSVECRRLRCALVRAQALELDCRRALELEQGRSLR